MIRSAIIYYFFCLAYLCSSGGACCSAQTVLLIRAAGSYPSEEEQIRNAATFYGLNIRALDISSKTSAEQASLLLKQEENVAVFISGDSLGKLNRSRSLAALRARPEGRIPLFVFGIAPDRDMSPLRSWSEGQVRSCVPTEDGFHPRTLQVGPADGLTDSLGGAVLPMVAFPRCNLIVSPGAALDTVLAAEAGPGTETAVLVRLRMPAVELFLSPQATPLDPSWDKKPHALPQTFSYLAPFMIFLSHAAGDRAWHLDGQYANLTIDDAWLIEPFGRLNYGDLLSEMEKHNFHTTLAFVPWNFDRSKPELVKLFHQHGNRYSICVHGNNHIHREFGDYKANPLEEQVRDIKQGVARMERFSTLTGIPYDRFMVFPHGVAPEPTFSALRTYGFLGTANASNVPLGNNIPADPMFLLRSYTTAYADLLSLSRYPASGEIPKTEIAIHSFLGNPLLFYDHAELFYAGAGAFNAHADAVNQVQPHTKWKSLGEIARHLHLLRRRTDGEFDVRMLSSEMDLENSTDKDEVFHVQIEGNTVGATLTIDGQPTALERAAPVRLTIAAHQTRRFRVAYQNDLDLSRQDIRKRSAQAYVLRMLSDFRDLHLARSAWGRSITRMYYARNWDTVELLIERNWWLFVICILLAIGGVRFFRSRRRSRS